MAIGTQQIKVFQDAKNALQDNTLLVHYDSSKQLVLACDASPHGLGAVLSHIIEVDQEKPVAYASRTLTTAEKNYSQLEKEALALVFGVGKFHNYLYGKHFIIESEQQPLSYILTILKQFHQQHPQESQNGHSHLVLIHTQSSTSCLVEIWVMLMP